MQIFHRFSRLISPRMVFLFALMASGLLMLLVGAHWASYYAAPRAASRPVMSVPSPLTAAQNVTSRHLFGQRNAAVAASAALAVDSAAVRVLGVASSGPSGGGFAIVSIDGKPPIPAVDGQEFSPGFRLKKVTANGIEYERGGILMRSALQEKKSNNPSVSGNLASSIIDQNRSSANLGRAAPQSLGIPATPVMQTLPPTPSSSSSATPSSAIIPDAPATTPAS